MFASVDVSVSVRTSTCMQVSQLPHHEPTSSLFTEGCVRLQSVSFHASLYPRVLIFLQVSQLPHHEPTSSRYTGGCVKLQSVLLHASLYPRIHTQHNSFSNPFTHSPLHTLPTYNAHSTHAFSRPYILILSVFNSCSCRYRNFSTMTSPQPAHTHTHTHTHTQTHTQVS